MGAFQIFTVAQNVPCGTRRMLIGLSTHKASLPGRVQNHCITAAVTLQETSCDSKQATSSTMCPGWDAL